MSPYLRHHTNNHKCLINICESFVFIYGYSSSVADILKETSMNKVNYTLSISSSTNATISIQGCKAPPMDNPLPTESI